MSVVKWVHIKNFYISLKYWSLVITDLGLTMCQVLILQWFSCLCLKVGITNLSHGALCYEEQFCRLQNSKLIGNFFSRCFCDSLRSLLDWFLRNITLIGAFYRQPVYSSGFFEEFFFNLFFFEWFFSGKELLLWFGFIWFVRLVVLFRIYPAWWWSMNLLPMWFRI